MLHKSLNNKNLISIICNVRGATGEWSSFTGIGTSTIKMGNGSRLLGTANTVKTFNLCNTNQIEAIMKERSRIEKTKNDILIILKSTKPFDELSLALSNTMHKYNVSNMALTFEELATATALLTKQEPTEKQIKQAYERTRTALKRILDK